MPILYWPLLLLGAYLLGSVPFAQVLARINGVDLKEVGSRNVGAGNLSREVGMGWGAVAAVLDGLKGFFPVWIARKAGLGLGAAGIAGLAAVLGHNWSIWLRGRSGRGPGHIGGCSPGSRPGSSRVDCGMVHCGLEDWKWSWRIPWLGPPANRRGGAGSSCYGEPGPSPAHSGADGKTGTRQSG